MTDPAEGIGVLYVVATPIGNLGDLSPRAREVLSSADRILCEDTRRTGRLLEHAGIRGRLVSHHEHNEKETLERIVGWIREGEALALVSDAGTPLVSDPGFLLVRAIAELGGRIVPVPGPSAMLAALSVSGLPTDRFCFLGYLPARAGERARAIEAVASLTMTLVFYEAPHRLVAALGALATGLGAERRAVLCRELTKLHEEIVRGSLAEIGEWAGAHTAKGEITLVVAGAPHAERKAKPAFRAHAKEMFERLLAEGLSPEAAERRTREVFG